MLGLMTTQELARELKFSESTIRHWVQQGQLPAIRIGGQFRFRREDIEAWLFSNRTSQSKVSEEEPAKPERLKGESIFSSQEAWDESWRDFARRAEKLYGRK